MSCTVTPTTTPRMLSKRPSWSFGLGTWTHRRSAISAPQSRKGSDLKSLRWAGRKRGRQPLCNYVSKSGSNGCPS